MSDQINSQSMLRIGTVLRGIYRIDGYLSSGGFGNTYVATNIEFDERYAIKEFFMKGVTQRDGDSSTVSVSNSINQDSFLQQKEKFKKEARRIRQLKNEHIVAVHDLFEENGTAYYVMDFIDGENLSERLKRTGHPMTEEEVNAILPQILDALKTVHDAGIWHLDLKPANIMVDKSGQVKLIDFGASKQLNAQKGGATTSTAISYTNGYAPREQMEQNYDKFGPWTDLYALGATLYNLLTSKRPPLPTDIDDDISEDKHTALYMSNVSDKMKQLILWLMKTNRMQRPKTIQEVKEIKIEEKPIRVSPTIPIINQETKEEETIIASKNKEPHKNNLQSIIPSKEKVPKQDKDGGAPSDYTWLWILLFGCLIVGLILLLPLVPSSTNTTTPMEFAEEIIDTTTVDTALSTPMIMHEEPLSPTEEKVVGNHLFSLQWIESKYYGTCEITKEGDIYKCVALNESDDKTDYLKMEGNITIVSERHLKFTGTILRKVHYLYDGKEYRRDGTFDFKAWGSRKYWRGQNMDTPDGYDYIDIYFEKYE